MRQREREGGREGERAPICVDSKLQSKRVNVISDRLDVRREREERVCVCERERVRERVRERERERERKREREREREKEREREQEAWMPSGNALGSGMMTPVAGSRDICQQSSMFTYS